MDNIFSGNAAYLWLMSAAILAIAEIFVPGVFLIWIALAAAITGAVTFLAPLTLAGQLTLFGISALATVFLGRRWYLTHIVESNDPLLNNRAARLIGTTVTVVSPISATSGRVKVGDGEWSASGPAMKAGQIARVVDFAGGRLILEEIARD